MLKLQKLWHIQKNIKMKKLQKQEKIREKIKKNLKEI